MKKVFCIHVCLRPGFEAILNRILEEMENSGGGWFFDEVWVGTVGPYALRERAFQILRHYFSSAPLHPLGHEEHVGVYERFTLHLLHEKARHEDFQLFYCHSKGISKPHRVSVHLWVRAMVRFGIGYAPLVCQLLHKDPRRAVGCLLQTQPLRHFSGNFWWTTSTRLRALLVPIPSDYLAPEMWISGHTSPSPDTWLFSMINLLSIPGFRHAGTPPALLDPSRLELDHRSLSTHLSVSLSLSVLSSCRIMEGLGRAWSTCRTVPHFSSSMNVWRVHPENPLHMILLLDEDNNNNNDNTNNIRHVLLHGTSVYLD